MNRGTALKWIEQIKSDRYRFGNGQMRYEDQFDPLGVLADFLDPNGWEEAYIGYSWHGEVFKLPKFARDKCRIKTEYLEFVTDNGYKTNLANIIDGSNDWQTPLYYIERYYEQF